MFSMSRQAVMLLLVLILSSHPVGAEPMSAGKKDKCPVCGMFVAKYSDFLAQIEFVDGSHVFFDGAKDLFKYYFNIAHYDNSRKAIDIVAIYVTDYYSMSLIDGRQALYVSGSDVFGPMGRELIPFAVESDAIGFMKDHHGESMSRFSEVTFEMVKKLD